MQHPAAFDVVNGVGIVTQGYNGVLQYAHLEAQMSAKSNSSTCIQQDTCQPLGGHSIWGAAPPLPPHDESASSQLPIIMLLAPVDSTAFFKSETVVSQDDMLLSSSCMTDARMRASPLLSAFSFLLSAFADVCFQHPLLHKLGCGLPSLVWTQAQLLPKLVSKAVACCQKLNFC